MDTSRTLVVRRSRARGAKVPRCQGTKVPTLVPSISTHLEVAEREAADQRGHDTGVQHVVTDPFAVCARVSPSPRFLFAKVVAIARVTSVTSVSRVTRVTRVRARFEVARVVT